MARVLIVPCGTRGQDLARALVGEGHTVRGTTRDPAETGEIAAAGAEPYVGDPDVIGTLMGALEGTTIVCWLLGTADGDPDAVAALHGPRLQMLLERVVDTPVRGVVYEAAGSVPPGVLAEGRAVAERAHETWQIPLEVLEADPAERAAWLEAATLAVRRLLTP